MQVQQLAPPGSSNALVVGRGASSSLQPLPLLRTEPAPPLEFVVAEPVAPSDGATLAARPATPAREPGQQQRIGELQQGLAYLGKLQQSLQALKTGLSQALAGLESADTEKLSRKLGHLRQTWRARTAQAGRQVDAQLRPMAAGDLPRQRFQLRGLDLATLSGGSPETLRLAVPGYSQGITVQIDGRDLQGQLNGLRSAVAPAGLRLDAGAGELQFSVPESQWPSLRDGMTVRGEGKRFPSGLPVRAPLLAEADAITPEQWKIDNRDSQRDSLKRVLQAQQGLAPALVSLRGELAALNSQALVADDADERTAVERFAASFAPSDAADAEAALDYRQLATLTPALAGLHRRRIEQLLLPTGR